MLVCREPGRAVPPTHSDHPVTGAHHRWVATDTTAIRVVLANAPSPTRLETTTTMAVASIATIIAILVG